MTPPKVGMQCFSSSSPAQHPEKKYAPLIFPDIALRERYCLRRNNLRHYFRSLETSGQRFRPLDHRPEQVLDYVIFFTFVGPVRFIIIPILLKLC
ncbi:MAG: hypothetical protein PHH77_01375 [Victivallaceae bacterium]|nr:hypothetical protein [Victivallaceae bacterium]